MTHHQRRNISQPADWWAAFDAMAQKRGLTLSEWIGRVCSQSLPQSVKIKLSERRPANRPKRERQ